MKVSLLSYSDMEGGAARAAYRLHEGLQNIGVNSKMLVQIKSSDHESVIGNKNIGIRQAINGLRMTAEKLPLKYYTGRSNSTYSTQWLPDRVASQIADFSPDIVNLHWINNGYIQIESLAKIQQPIVWTLHDMWAFTGGCHYSQDCDRYTLSCGKCPQLKSHRDNDLSHKIWKRKYKAWKKINLTIITPSIWLSYCTKTSALFKNLHVKVIPNGVDTARYKPIDRTIARKILGLPVDNHLILAGALNSISDTRKGLHLLQLALKRLSQAGWSDRIELLIIGASEPSSPLDLGFKTHYMGTLNDDISLAMLYAAADVFIAPSLQDNLPNTVLESLSCGTPCVAFKIGGFPDIIDHQINGYLSRPYEIEDLAQGIVWILENSDRHQTLSDNARTTIMQNFTLEHQAMRYLKLFNELIEKSHMKSN
jgi:glycosyltransferase involved in cell wall biosynthesis